MSEEETEIEESVAAAGEDTEGVDNNGADAEAEAPSELELITQERDKLKDQLLRTAADFDNFRKRSRKELEQTRQRSKEEILRDVLPVFDNLERAVEAAGSAADVEAVQSGVTMVLKQWQDIATRIGLTRMVAKGERFDPNLHDAFQQQETDEVPPGTVVMEYQPGYRFGEKMLRPAMVVVARAPAAPPAEEVAESTPEEPEAPAEQAADESE
ncbi:MAG: nucleotide exchange factor GrpE [Sandaracinaceae bacterium]